MRRPRVKAPDRRQAHLDWLALVAVSGPFLTLPVLLRVWPDLVALDADTREQLSVHQVDWSSYQDAWVGWVLTDLLGWGEAWTRDGLEPLAIEVAEYDTAVAPSFALHDPATGDPALLGLQLQPSQHPTSRVAGDVWAATPVDRIAQLCRARNVELGLVTDGRWWALVWAPVGGVTTTAVFDSVTWPESGDRIVVRAFRSLLERPRFFAVAQNDRLTALFRESLNNQEDVTETLGVQVRRAVEMLVDAIGRDDLRRIEETGRGLEVSAHEVYRAAVSVMMRVVFLLYAEERGLLPSDNPLYEAAYSASRLGEQLEQQASAEGEDVQERSTAAWQRMLALFRAVYGGVRHPQLTTPAYDGSIFDPKPVEWLESVTVDDRTVMHMLTSVQYVTIAKERRRLSFRALDVEQIGYVYEGLLSFEGFRAEQAILGLTGKEGIEEEAPLSTLEGIAALHPDVRELAKALAEKYKDSKIGSAAAIEKKLAPLSPAEATEARRLLLAATAGDSTLVDRVLRTPFYRMIRGDLRGLPVVIRAGSLYVTESTLRKSTGTHYTPRFLAEQIVEGALEPLVYTPGPLQTADHGEWRLRSSGEILALKVADIAMGSGAFLVAACRYLSRKLIEAWSKEGDQRAREWVDTGEAIDLRADAEADDLVIEARRQIIERCLYGVDINPMAVDMAKLSLWLTSADKHRPFTFLDDRLVAGDSLLGITSIEQLEAMHLDPAKGRAQLDLQGVTELARVRELVADIATARIKLAGRPGLSLDDLDEKRADLAAIDKKTAHARRYADLIVGAALANAGRGDRTQRDGAVAAANHARRVSHGLALADDAARDMAGEWLSTDLPAGAGFARQPLHWPLAFPEVFDRGGFDSIIGNPPFLGGKKITGALGVAYRELLVHTVGRNVKGHADLVAYFVLRVHSLLNTAGQAGLIATNTVAQGDTREVGLDQVVADGVEIRRAIKSRPWPARSAQLEFAALWTTVAASAPAAARVLDDRQVAAIDASLDAKSRATGKAERLAANSGLSFIGSFVLGMGFTMEPDKAAELIRRDARNGEVLFPYLNGKDLNSRPHCDASRWVINFFDWSIERARTYLEPLQQVEVEVRPERQKRKADGSYALRRPLPERYWQYADKRPALYGKLAEFERAIVITLVSKVVMPVMVQTRQVFSHALGVFATDDLAMLALLSSAPHYWWAIARASTMKGDLRYTPTDVFETFARPELTEEMREIGDRLDSYRRGLMLARNAGLTATYNLVHSPQGTADDITELRRIHVAIDEAVARAYGWEDLDLDHGFHETRQGTRYTVGSVARQEILDRLLELNHERYAAEQAAGVAAPVQEELDLDPIEDGGDE